MLKKFNQIFKQKVLPDQGRMEFINRMNILFLEVTDDLRDVYGHLARFICDAFGENFNDYTGPSLLNRPQYLALESIAKNDFHRVMKTAIAIAQYCYKNNEWHLYRRLRERIPQIINDCSTPIGVRWHEDFFYPDPIPEIDEALVNENLLWLDNFPAAKADFQIALKNFHAGKLQEVLPYCYKGLENIVQVFTSVNKPLHNSELQKALIQRLQVSDSWRQFLVKFVDYANDYGRHGKSETRLDINPDELESYLFLSLQIVRLISKRKPIRK